MGRVAARAGRLAVRLQGFGVPVNHGGPRVLTMPGFSFMVFGRYGWGPHNNKSARLAIRQMISENPEKLAVAICMDPDDASDDVIVSMRAKDWAALASAFVQTDPDRYITKEN